MNTTLYQNIPAAQLGITRIEAWEARDSRTFPTIGCRVTLEDGSLGRAFVPANLFGGSPGTIDLRDGLENCDRLSLRWAVEQIRKFNTDVQGVGAYDIEQQLDGQSKASLAVSMAMAQAVAVAAQRPLWQLLDTAGQASLPCPMVTIFSGPQRANDGVSVRDFLAVPLAARSFAEAVEIIWEVRRIAAELLEKRSGRLPLEMPGNRGTLITFGGTNTEPLEILTAAIEAVGAPVGIAIEMGTKQTSDRESLLSTLENWCEKYPIVSIEDPMDAEDCEGWIEVSRRFGHLQLIGNRLFATDANRVKRAFDNGVANAVLVKPKRIGTLSGAYEALWYSKSVGYRTVVSARSADSEDSTIADLAVGWNAGQIKIGSIMRSERVAKYNRLLEIEDAYQLPYSGWVRSSDTSVPMA